MNVDQERELRQALHATLEEASPLWFLGPKREAIAMLTQRHKLMPHHASRLLSGKATVLETAHLIAKTQARDAQAEAERKRQETIRLRAIEREQVQRQYEAEALF